MERWGAQALEETKSSNLLFWGSRFHLFVSWSADRAHPWDALPAAGHYAMLEIGNHRGTDGQARTRISHARLIVQVSDHARAACHWFPDMMQHLQK